MFREYLLLCLGAIVVQSNGGTTVEETLPKDVLYGSQAPEAVIKTSPLHHPGEGSKTDEKIRIKHSVSSYSTPGYVYKPPVYSDWPLFPFYFPNYNPYFGSPSQNPFLPASSYNNLANAFFQSFASYFNQLPSWFAFNFSPLASTYNYQSVTPSQTSSTVSSTPVTSSISTPTVTSTSQPAQNPLSGFLSSLSSGSQPVFSSSSSYSSSTGDGNKVSGGYVSTGGGGKPIQEQQFVSTDGGSIQISSSTGGKGFSVSSIGPFKRGIESFEEQGLKSNPEVEAKRYTRQVGLNAAQVGIQAAQVGNNAGQIGAQAGIQAAQTGIYAGQIGAQIGQQAAQQSLYASGVRPGLYGVHVPY